MTTVNNSYAAPSDLGLAVSKNGTVDVGQRVINLHVGETLTLYPMLMTAYTGNQTQYRIRHRKAYAVGLLEDPSGAEVWTDYPDWTTPSGATVLTRMNDYSNWRYAAGLSFTLAHSLSTYDLYEVEVRSRVYNSTADTCSEWAYGTVLVAPSPSVTSVTATTDAYGWLEFNIGTDWVRGGCLIGFWDILDAAQKKGTMHTFSTGADVGADPSILVASGAKAGSLRSQVAYLRVPGEFGTTFSYSEDGGCSMIADSDGGYIVSPGAHVDPGDVPTPTVAIDSASDPAAVFVNITCACDSVVARAEYADADGNDYTSYLDVASTGTGTWRAVLDAPPLGVEMTIRAACCNSSGQYKIVSATTTLAATSHCYLDGDGDHVALAYEGEYGSQTDLDGESVICAGRKLPVSRHGMAVSRSIDVKGTIAFPSVFPWGDMELSGLNVLDNPHDWVFRNPKGVRKRVRVTSWSVDQDTEQLGRVAEVTINMEEVA